ncbi:MAG: DNA cytosine methyltransferase [Spiroplasmataceae bacterium]|nr:DNA cytosine methyltransferase [Spiroplasmataceae bacterium]
MKVAEMFAGAGGLALGLEKAGFKNICCLEIDKWATKTLKKNRGDWKIIEDDIAVFVDNFSKYNFPEIDLLSGGFPCQSFSYAGKKAGFQDKRGETFHHFAKLIDIWKPKSFLIENVRGLISHQKGKTFKNIIKILESKGYKVYWKVLNAWNYGVSQKRERVFIVGFKQSLLGDNFQFSFPKEHEYKPNLRDALKGVPSSEGAEYPQSKKKVLDLIPMGGCWRDLPEEIAREYMKKSYFLGGGKTGMARRISWEEPSLALTTSPQQKQTERCHPEETRPFAVREYARIQSFPDNWEFTGSMLNKYKQIGNAVPVNLAKEVGIAIKKTLSSISNE